MWTQLSAGELHRLLEPAAEEAGMDGEYSKWVDQAEHGQIVCMDGIQIVCVDLEGACDSEHDDESVAAG